MKEIHKMNFRNLISVLFVMFSQISLSECGLIERGKVRATRQLYLPTTQQWHDQASAKADAICRGAGRCTFHPDQYRVCCQITPWTLSPQHCSSCPNDNWVNGECHFCVHVPGISTTTTPPPSGGGTCFPSTARVSLENGNSIAMSKVQIGDKIQTVTSDGSIRFSEVISFLHKEPTGVSEYWSITTSSNNTITLSGEHLIYARRNNNYNFYPIYAKQVLLGDEVLIEISNILIPTEVIDVSNFMMQGAYVPLTVEGNIIVDGVLASCYPYGHHDLAHISTTPIHWFPQIMKWIFGEENGFLGFVKIAEDLEKVLLLFHHM